MKRLILCHILFVSGLTQAATTCKGKVDRVQLTKQGWVELISSDIYQSNTGRRLCNISAEYESVEPQTCQGWYSLLLASKASSSPIRMTLYNGACDEQGTWAEAEVPHMISHDS